MTSQNTQSPDSTAAQGVDIGGWLWHEFMTLCKNRGVHPGTNNDLFSIVTKAREQFAATSAKPADEVIRSNALKEAADLCMHLENNLSDGAEGFGADGADCYAAIMALRAGLPLGETKRLPPSGAAVKAEPVAWTVFSMIGQRRIALPEYAAINELGVRGKIQEAAYKEGYRGPVNDRMTELGWSIGPVYDRVQPPTAEPGQTKPKCVIYLDADQIDVAQFYRAKGFQHLPPTPTMTGAEIRACGWKKNNYQMYIDVTPMVPVGDTEAIALVDGMKFFCIPPATW